MSCEHEYLEERKQGLPTDTLDALKELELALVNHRNWTKDLHRALLLNEDVPESDISSDAHQRCHFGLWYYSTGNKKILELDGFRQVGELHKEVHDTARKFFTDKQAGNGVKADVYDSFVDLVHLFRSSVHDLQFTIISDLCTIDYLTGVWNRHSMSHRISQEMERTRRSGKPSSIALIDFDYFKNINDKYGHIIGDAVLQNIAQFMSEHFREYDEIFRYGGEEFLLLFPETDIEVATVILDRFQNDVKSVSTRTSDGHDIYITVSIGLSGLDVSRTEKEVIDNADKALLIAKSNGRDRLEVWT